MRLGRKLLFGALGWLMRLACRVDRTELEKVPAQGPLLLVVNHIGSLEVPLLFSHLQPRPVLGLAKVETWANPFLAFLFNQAGAIPLRRGVADVGALRQAVAALQAGGILAVAPEGTRSGHGRLQEGHAGVVMLALHSGAPVLPLAHYGGEALRRNLARLRRTEFKVVVGRPFYLDPGGAAVTRQVRREMVSEVMFQLAALLPPAYRGEYADLERADERYLRFPAGSGSNLERAM